MALKHSHYLVLGKFLLIIHDNVREIAAFHLSFQGKALTCCS